MPLHLSEQGRQNRTTRGTFPHERLSQLMEKSKKSRAGQPPLLQLELQSRLSYLRLW